MPSSYWQQKPENGGYEMLQGNDKVDGEWINTAKVPHHRLCAVAWYGLDAVESNEIHHRVSIPWLNIPSNLLPLPQPEHANLTHKFSQQGTPQSVVDDVTAELGGGNDE